MNGSQKPHKLSLVDIIYGVVIGYGYSRFEYIDAPIEYLSFGLSIVIIIVDYIYIHKLYAGEEYESNFKFIMDVLILFTISRIMNGAVHISDNKNGFWFWLAIYFLFSTFWDISFIRTKDILRNWKVIAICDGVVFFIFLSIFSILQLELVSRGFSLLIVSMIIYTVTIYLWLRKTPPEVPQ